MTDSRAYEIVRAIDPALFADLERAIRVEMAGTIGLICGNEWSFTQDLTDKTSLPHEHYQELVTLWHSQLYRHYRGEGVAFPARKAQEVLTAMMYRMRRDRTSGMDLFTFRVPELRPLLKEQRREAARRRAENLAGADREAMLAAVAEPYRHIFIESGYLDDGDSIENAFSGRADDLENALVAKVFGIREGLLRELTRAVERFSITPLDSDALNTTGFLDS